MTMHQIETAATGRIRIALDESRNVDISIEKPARTADEQLVSVWSAVREVL